MLTLNSTTCCGYPRVSEKHGAQSWSGSVSILQIQTPRVRLDEYREIHDYRESDRSNIVIKNWFP